MALSLACLGKHWIAWLYVCVCKHVCVRKSVPGDREKSKVEQSHHKMLSEYSSHLCSSSSLPVCLSLCLFAYLSVYLPFHFKVCSPLCLFVSAHPESCIFAHLSTCLPNLSTCLLCIPVSLSLLYYLSVFLHICLDLCSFPLLCLSLTFTSVCLVCLYSYSTFLSLSLELYPHVSD